MPGSRLSRICLALIAAVLFAAAAAAEAPRGYYRYPTLSGSTIVFTSEGDLWTVGIEGGLARRLTSHLGSETQAQISPDGQSVAFSGEYEGPREAYVMPLAGGPPKRLTWGVGDARVVGWTPRGEVMVSTQSFSTLPNTQLLLIEPKTGARRLLPLAQAADGTYDETGRTLYFTRLPPQGSFTKRYKGGTAQALWRYVEGEAEATALTSDYPGTSTAPMWWQGRLHFVSDRDGTRNLWSMKPDGSELRQLTRHRDWDVKRPDLDSGRIVYQLGADIHLLDLRSGEDREVPIQLSTDLDQQRERWIEKPIDWLTAAHLSPEGDRLVLTARGQVFVTPVKNGRRVEVTRKPGVRYRSALFEPDGTSILALSDESGEVEWWRLDARGVREREQLTRDATTLRFDGQLSPDGKKLAYFDHRLELWVLDVPSRTSRKVDHSVYFGFDGLAWSPDSRYLAYGAPAENFFSRLKVFDAETGESFAVTSDRFDSRAPAWSSDGKYLYFLTSRNLVSLAQGVWGSYQPQPFLDRKWRVFFLGLQKDARSPFVPPNEIVAAAEKGEAAKKKDAAAAPSKNGDSGAKAEPVRVQIDREGLLERLFEVPMPPGNYDQLDAGNERLFLLEATTERRAKLTLITVPIKTEDVTKKTILEDVRDYELSADRKKLLVRKEDALYVHDAGGEPLSDLGKARVALDDWRFAIDPREEWRQMYTDAWRLLRDYFYDPGMHGVDWKAVHARYLPLVERITERGELDDVLGEVTGELEALHHFVRSVDVRGVEKEVEVASLGALLERDESADGYRVARLYEADPDLPEELSPLARPGVGVSEGEVIVAINGVRLLTVPDPGMLLRNQAGKQVLLTVKPSARGPERELIVEPVSPDAADELRYDAWELERRRAVDELGAGELGYVHLRAMGAGNYSEWARHYFPVFNRKGLIIDARHNRGGNIDSWILGSLIRRPWMWWAPRNGVPYRNMQFSFNGPMVVLVDEFTASDGEAFAEGFRRLGLGKVIGTRTWGGEIWLTSSNLLVDRGIASAAEFGVYGPEGEWLIEGHGVEPDIVVDNLPRATQDGQDAQLEAAIAHLKQRIAEEKPAVPPVPEYPKKGLPGEQ